MYRFHVALHAQPVGIAAAVDPSSAALSATGLPVSFEQAANVLQTLPRLFFEPDGSFVWVSETAVAGWQVDGSLYDRGDRLAYVELKGCCPPEAFDALLRAFGWPAVPLVFQLVREAVFLDEVSFRRWAEGS